MAPPPVLRLLSAIRSPEWRRCRLCGHRFIETTLPPPFVFRLGTDALAFCRVCLGDFLFLDFGNPDASRDDIVDYLADLARLIERVPARGEEVEELRSFPLEQRIAIVHVLARKPTVARVNELFGSWLAALVKAMLPDGTRPTARGTHSIAVDGHFCHSLAEKTIDDMLTRLGIEHTREDPYPEGSYRSDFRIKDVHIEFLGLAGNRAYDARTTLKRDLAARHGMPLVLLTAADLEDRSGFGDRARTAVDAAWSNS